MDVVKTDKKVLIKWFITIAIAVIAQISIPANEVITPQIKTYIVITLLGICIMAFELLPDFIIGLALPLSYVLTGVTTMAVAFSPWLQTTTVLIVSILLMAKVFDEIGLLKRVGYWCVWKCGGTLYGAVWGVFFASVAISIATFANGTVIAAALAYTICKALDLKPSKESGMLMVAVILGSLTSRFFLYCPVNVGVLNAATQTVVPDFNLNWMELVGHNVPTVIFVFGFMWIYLKVMKAKESKLSIGKDLFKEKYKDLGPITVAEKKATVLFILVMIYALLQPIHKLDMAYGFAILVMVFYLPGINIGSQSAIQSIPFGIVFILVACLAIGTVATSLGIVAILTTYLVPIISAFSPKVALLATMIFGGIANFVLTPFAMTATLPAPVSSVCLAMGWDVRPFIYAMYLSTDIVFLPYEFVGYLVVYAFGMISMKHIVTVSTIRSLAFIVFFAAVMIPFWSFLGII